MSKLPAAALIWAAFWSASCGAAAPSTAASITIRTTAAVERTAVVNGREIVRLAPANRVVAGDRVVYTLAVRNNGPGAANTVSFTSPIPRLMAYLDGSAVGPGAKVSFSIDGGRTYGRPKDLSVRGAHAKPRPAAPSDYTNIRWTLRDPLQAGSVAYARFTAVLK